MDDRELDLDALEKVANVAIDPPFPVYEAQAAFARTFTPATVLKMIALTRLAAAPEPLRVAETTGQIDPEAIEALCQRLELRVENATEYAVTATQKSAREELLRAAQTMRALLSHWEQARLDYSAESILVQEMHTLRSERDAAEALASTAPLRVAGEEVERAIAGVREQIKDLERYDEIHCVVTSDINIQLHNAGVRRDKAKASDLRSVLALIEPSAGGGWRRDIEPTSKMIAAGMPWLAHWKHMRPGDQHGALASAFKAMLAVSPTPDQPKPEVKDV